MMDKAATGASGQDLVLSVVVPIYNEADNIGPFLQRLERALDGLEGGYEVICVDDGSTDDTLRVLRDLAERDPEVVIASWCGRKVDPERIRNRPGWNRVAANRTALPAIAVCYRNCDRTIFATMMGIDDI